MRKKLYLFPLFVLVFFLFATTSCLNSDNNNEVAVDEVWKALNESRFAKVASDDSFNALSSQTGYGKVYWQKSTEITNVDQGNTVRISVEGRPEFTDTVVVRYEGWFFDKDEKKVIFDSTENPSLISTIKYRYGLASSTQPNYNKATFAVNPRTDGTYTGVYGVIEGWSTLLQDMKVGDERLVCIPQELAYGGTANTYTPNVTGAPTFTIVPAYTTLWFRVKLYEIIPMKPLNS
ncbi:FKBP-type peptidyl-prolyl cis-trans isomerase [Dysgonomonas alginatilytica]|nr:FKBP-type peptidyl-prolyl cis-trans isomerase [Dysgonomonas alginatilytica]